MDIRNGSFTCAQARELDMVTYLASLGHSPARIRNSDHWYCSPLREESTPSFKINRRLNRWYDHGLGKGGNLIDFALLYHGCTVSELLQALAKETPAQRAALQSPLVREQAPPLGRLTVLSRRPLSSRPLCRYLRQRGISPAIAARYCQEVTYSLYGKEYRAIGFRNDAGGYELRNPFVKASSSPKSITTMDNGAREVVVLEGFMDFLSFQEIHKSRPEGRYNFVVLNSVAFFEKARPFMERHEAIRLYLDNDAAGQQCSRHALSLSSSYRDESGRYHNRKDLNEWLVRHRKRLLKATRQRPR